MALPATENFTGADGTQINSLSDWDAGSDTSTSGMDIQSNSAAPDHASTSQINWWTSDSFNNDQYSTATVVAITNSIYIGLCVRASGTDGGSDVTDYHWNSAANDQGYLEKFVSGSYTQLASGGSTLSTNDVLRMEVSGTSLTCKIDGVTDLSDTDSSISSGAAGVVGYGDSSGSRLDDWEGGNVAAGLSIPVAMHHYMHKVFG